MKRFSLKSNNTTIAVTGWLGAFLILLAYFLVSFDFLQPHQPMWQIINFTGSLGIITAALPKKDWPAMGLNIVFALIALIALIRIWMHI